MRKSNSHLFLIVMMGILVGFPALITDTYLPAFPAMTDFFNTSVSAIQMSLMASMVGIAAGQLVIGPLSDKYGRIAPLIVSLCLFIISTICSLFTANIYIFNFYRLIQGVACSSGMVLSRAILTDSFTGRKLSKSLSVNTAVLGLTPATAPIIGGLLLTVTNWHGIFIFLLAIGIVILFLTFRLEESLPVEKRNIGYSAKILYRFLPVLKNKKYLQYVSIFSFSMAVMFAYISASPFIFEEHYGLSSLTYSLLYGLNALALALGSFFASKFQDQHDALKAGVFGLLAMSVITVAVLLFNAPYTFFEASLFIMFLFNGIIYPSSTTLAMELQRQNAGTASAILGSLSFLIGGIISPLVGIGDVVYAVSTAIVLCSIITFLCWLGLRKE